jgi:hypothetical protein
VSVGRTAAAALSSAVIAAVFLAVRRFAGTPQALLAAMFVSSSYLLMNFGASELPGRSQPFSSSSRIVHRVVE